MANFKLWKDYLILFITCLKFSILATSSRQLIDSSETRIARDNNSSVCKETVVFDQIRAYLEREDVGRALMVLPVTWMNPKILWDNLLMVRDICESPEAVYLSMYCGNRMYFDWSRFLNIMDWGTPAFNKTLADSTRRYRELWGRFTQAMVIENTAHFCELYSIPELPLPVGFEFEPVNKMFLELTTRQNYSQSPNYNISIVFPKAVADRIKKDETRENISSKLDKILAKLDDMNSRLKAIENSINSAKLHQLPQPLFDPQQQVSSFQPTEVVNTPDTPDFMSGLQQRPAQQGSVPFKTSVTSSTSSQFAVQGRQPRSHKFT